MLSEALMYLFILEREQVVWKQEHIIIKYAMEVLPYYMKGH